jgi:hypothetical protein
LNKIKLVDWAGKIQRIVKEILAKHDIWGGV